MVYDYLIVGAGSAGCVLADRLSADSTASVLVVESGPDVRPSQEPEEMRGRHPYRMERPAMSRFRYDTVLARRTDAQDPRPYIRGRGTGGSSIVNGHLAIRGSLPGDFDTWARSGCTGWSAAETLPAFLALENDLDFGAEDYHGTTGPLPISRAPEDEWTGFDRAFRDAALAHGHPWAVDHNAPGSTGVSPFAAILDADGRRVSASRAFLEQARAREDVTILTDARVSRIEFEGNRAVGVSATVEGLEQSLRAREIILCGGAVHTPTILMRSGIGPAQQLALHGLEVRQDLPVGEGLQDHASVWLGVTTSTDRPAVEPRFANCCVRYGSGLSGASDNDMFMSSVNTTVVPEVPYDAIVNVSVFAAHSRGHVALASADPAAEPVMEMRMASDPRDAERLRDGVRRLWAMIETMRRNGGVDRVAVMPTGRWLETPPREDAELDRWIAAVCSDAAHVTGSCRMGDPADPSTVVDPCCRVLGTDGLRVVDASVMPEIPSANTQVPTLMIAERAAALLLADVS